MFILCTVLTSSHGKHTLFGLVALYVQFPSPDMLLNHSQRPASKALVAWIELSHPLGSGRALFMAAISRCVSSVKVASEQGAGSWERVSQWWVGDIFQWVTGEEESCSWYSRHFGKGLRLIVAGPRSTRMNRRCFSSISCFIVSLLIIHALFWFPGSLTLRSGRVE